MSYLRILIFFCCFFNSVVGFGQVFIVFALEADTICPFECTQLNVAVTGQPPITYDWTNSNLMGPGPHTICPEETTIYTLVATDATGQSDTQSITQFTYAPPDIVADGVFDNCGNCTGSLDATATGTPPFSYQWDAAAGNQTDTMATDLCLGTYELTVTDGNGCSEFVILNIFGIPPVTQTIDVLNEVMCFEDENGSATGSISGGGSPPFSYNWSNGETTPTAVALPGGMNFLTITDDDGCEYFFEVEITGALEIVGNVSTTGVACAGALGTATVSPLQGTGPYTYEWSNGDTGEMISNLIVGIYDVTIYDANNCPSAPIPFEIIEEENVPQIIFEVTPISCNGGADGSIGSEVFSGEPGYTYLWSTGDVTSSINNLSIGSYTLSVTDAVGCLSFGTIELVEPAPGITTFSTFPTSCYEFEDGQIIIDTTMGGTAPYLYAIDNNQFLQNLTFNNLAGGPHELLTQDALGCIYSQMIDIGRPPEIFVNIGNDITVELGETHEIEVNQNAAGDPTFVWVTPDTLNCIDSVTNYCQTYEVLPTETGTYILTVFDTAGCFGLDELLITVEKEYNIYLPNIFSPNEDGHNDVYYIQSGIDVKQILNFRIFDRWGSTLYEATDFMPNDLTISWDGRIGTKKAQSGVYLAVAEVEFFDGITKTFSIDFALLR